MSNYDDNRFFISPPYNRQPIWKPDSDYQVPVVSSIGAGPKGDKGDDFDPATLTEENMEMFVNFALAHGLQGPEGPEGPQGEEGPVGPQWIPTDEELIDVVQAAMASAPMADIESIVSAAIEGGAIGKSAYDVAVDNGFEGTEAEWLATLKGDKGDTGDFDQMTTAEQDEVIQYVGARTLAASLQKASGKFVTTEDYTNEITIPIANYASTDILIVSIEGLVLIEGSSFSSETVDDHTDYTINNGDYAIVENKIILDEPIVHAGTTVLFQIIRASWQSSGEGGEPATFPVEDVINAIYPIGSIYMSTNSLDPGTRFGVGTWEQIEDTFLLAAGQNHAAGDTGGEERVTLTANESGMPVHGHSNNLVIKTPSLSHSVSVGQPTFSHAHAHNLPNSAVVYNASGAQRLATSGSGTKVSLNNASGADLNTGGATTNWTTRESNASVSVGAHAAAQCTKSGGVQNAAALGAAESHENMPPYLAVYVWKRVA